MAFTGRLYKFKTVSNVNIEALIKNQLWISNLYKMNDPMELGFYVDKNKIDFKYEDNDIIKFQKYLTSYIYCASFTTIYSNKRLWNYYSNGFTGFVIGYKSSEIKKALEKIKLYGSEQLVNYKNYKSSDYSELFVRYMQDENISDSIEWKSLYTKDKSWEEEREYRYSINNPDINHKDKNGFLLDIKPSVVIVGYKIDEESFEKIKKYCQDNLISLKKYMPKFDTKEIDYKTIDILKYRN